jgi:mRNA-degrading endonuclease RelE of RelBE toxin-antitoxin system
MTVPQYVIDSIDLLNRAEHDQIIKNLFALEQIEKDLPGSIRKLARLIKPNLYLYHGSRRYRIVLEIIDNHISILDIVHHDKVSLAIRKRGL